MGSPSLVGRFLDLLESGLLSDVTFIVGEEEEEIAAHKNVLAMGSLVFQTMFLSQFREKSHNVQIPLPDVEPIIFRNFLRYIYCEKIRLSPHTWAATLYVAEKYDVPKLKSICMTYLEMKWTPADACFFYDQARNNGVLGLTDIKETLVLNPDKYLVGQSLLSIQEAEGLSELLSSDKLDMEEIEVFRIAITWARNRLKQENIIDLDGSYMRNILGPALYTVRFTRMTAMQVNHDVDPLHVLSEEEKCLILDRIKRNPAGEREDDPAFIFTVRSRIRSIRRIFRFGVRRLKRTNMKMVFRVDKPIRVLGYEICRPACESSSILGVMFIYPEYQVRLGVRSCFEVRHDRMSSTSEALFKEDYAVVPGVWYVAFLEVWSSPKKVNGGDYKKIKQVVNGVTWHFRNTFGGGKGILASIIFKEP